MLDLAGLLETTSRTFALTIPTLPMPLQRQVGLAYLLFRVIDTLEDAVLWTPSQKRSALDEAALTLAGSSAARFPVERWLNAPPTSDAAHLRLLSQSNALLEALEGQGPAARRAILSHARRTAEGMGRVVVRADVQGNLTLGSLRELQDYCYVVAGIVGELLTGLFILDTPSLMAEQRELERHMAAFGEGLQLVNILKDAAQDAAEGRVFLPLHLERDEVHALARRDLDRGSQYVAALQRGGAPRGYLAFTGLALLLARRSLELLAEHGPGARVTRAQVASLWARLSDDLDAGRAMGQATA